jgi:hypothetical protein
MNGIGKEYFNPNSNFNKKIVDPPSLYTPTPATEFFRSLKLPGKDLFSSGPEIQRSNNNP